MKRVYPLFPLAACIYLMAAIPLHGFAQCTCTGGLPATPIYQYATLAPTTVAVANVSFNQFNPSIGTLTCIGMVDTISAVSTTHVWNKAASKAKYKFQLFLNNDIEGPGGISATSSYNKIYGPDSLEAAGVPGDSITYGPDSIYVDNIDSNGTSSSAAYLGGGTVNFTYTINGGLTSLIGGLNYGDSIYTTYFGHFRLTYYWCPALVLSTSIEQFTATPDGNTLLLQWLVNNAQNNTTYTLQVSTDGQNFSNLGNPENSPVAEGTATKYQYPYNLDQTSTGPLYFRVKVIDAGGNVTYSQILLVNPDGSGANAPISYRAFPNPATNSLVFQFNSNQTGHFTLELINTAGQVVGQRIITLAGTSQIPMELSPQPARGLYFLRARDLTHNQEYVSKVLID